MAPRAYWKGHVRLSLVAFPVQLFTATATGSRISFNQIHGPTGQRVRYQKTVPGVGPVEPAEIVKGYEVAKGSYVTLAEEELAAIKLESKHTIDLVQFVGACEIDPLYYEKPYFMVPDGAVAQEAFRVIRQALRETGQVALGQVVLGGRESFVALKPCGKGILLETLRTVDEVRKAAPYFAEIEDGPVDEDQLALARQLIERKAAPFDPARFVDRYEAALRELIEAKAKGRRIQIARGPAARGGQVIDLMAALKKSLSEERQAKPGGPAELRDHPRKAAAKQPAGPAPSRRARAAPAERIPAPKPSRQAARGRKSA